MTDIVYIGLPGKTTLYGSLSQTGPLNIDVNGTNTVSFDDNVNIVSGCLKYGGTDSIMGTYYQYAESLGVSSTTDNISPYTTKLTLTPSTSLPSGTYRIGWTYSAYNDGESGIIQLNVDSNIEMTTNTTRDGKTYESGGGFHHMTLSGTPDIKIMFGTTTINKTTYIKEVRLELWRIN